MKAIKNTTNLSSESNNQYLSYNNKVYYKNNNGQTLIFSSINDVFNNIFQENANKLKENINNISNNENYNFSADIIKKDDLYE